MRINWILLGDYAAIFFAAAGMWYWNGQTVAPVLGLCLAVFVGAAMYKAGSLAGARARAKHPAGRGRAA